MRSGEAVTTRNFALLLLQADLRRTVRDPIAVILGVLPVAVTMGWWLAAPAVTARLLADPALVNMVALVVLVLLAPLMFGFVAGLMLLDERDEGVLNAVAITTIGTRGVMAVRMAAPAAWSFLLAVVILLLLADARPALMLGVGLLAALQAPLMMLILATFAGNKVQGMALSKVANVLVLLGGLAVLLPAPWLWLAAPSPHFWLTLLLTDPPRTAVGTALFLAGAVVVHLAALRALAGRRH
jgi:fluoroquinolone transport system permease protein